jgi:hypothetical protein
MKAVSFNEIKRQEAQSRMAAAQRRASLVGISGDFPMILLLLKKASFESGVAVLTTNASSAMQPRHEL